MQRPIALAHGSEGGGNANRMLAVAEKLRTRDVPVLVAGGGPGATFLERNGFDEFEPTTIDFISQRGEEGKDLVGTLVQVAPRAAKRFREFREWLDAVEPAVLLTDDPFATIAATILDVPFFRIDHSSVSCYDRPFERLAFTIFNGYSLRCGEAFFYISVFDDPYPDRPAVVPVGPVAHVPPEPEAVEPFDVLIAPSTYSIGFDSIAEQLSEEGLSVTLVGGPDWETVDSLYPYAEAADVMLCSGFSSLAHAAVAGTPVINYPFIDCQCGIADRIEREGVRGIRVVRSADRAVEAVLDQPDPPEVENGAIEVAERLVGYRKWVEEPDSHT
ncbi:MAG: glycosyltransferase [Halodesulfurarchaeum sp.]